MHRNPLTENTETEHYRVIAALFAGRSRDAADPKATATATSKPTQAPTSNKRNLLSYTIEDNPSLLDGDK